MTAPTSSDHYLLLSLPERPGADPDTRPAFRSPCLDVRCLNAAGRWAVQGFPRAPLLVWPPTQDEAARAAAERAARARGRPVEVVTRSDARWVEGQDIRPFTEASEPALHGCEAHSAGKARRLGIEMEKLAAFSLVVRAAAAATSQAAYAEVSRAASKALRARFGGGSIASTCAWLAGRAGRDALASLLAGEVEMSGPLSVHEVVAAVELARDIDVVQRTGTGH
ncbi:MAG TPA: hypothetical protein VMR43_13715 [Variovorax sp.]|nr:hypothetical protein [Variovorax sp.]